jgi:hypothetical protein
MGENRVWIEDGQKAPPPDKPVPKSAEDGDIATPKQEAPTEDDKPPE